MKIRSVGAELFYADRQTDEANSPFLQSCESAYQTRSISYWIMREFKDTKAVYVRQ
jgi:hypothetical protein